MYEILRLFLLVPAARSGEKREEEKSKTPNRFDGRDSPSDRKILKNHFLIMIRPENKQKNFVKFQFSDETFYLFNLLILSWISAIGIFYILRIRFNDTETVFVVGFLIAAD